MSKLFGNDFLAKSILFLFLPTSKLVIYRTITKKMHHIRAKKYVMCDKYITLFKLHKYFSAMYSCLNLKSVGLCTVLGN